MNKYIEEYISRRKEEMIEEERLAKEAEMAEVFARIKLGEREYQDQFPDESYENFPYYDSIKNKYFRYSVGDISDEEYEELLKYVPKNDKPVVESKYMSGWYTFAIILMVLGCIGGIIAGINADSVEITIALILGILIFFSQIILLCKIEYNTRSNQ